MERHIKYIMEQDELQILSQQIQAIDTKFQTLRGYL